MKKIMQVIKEGLRKKSFWLPESVARMVEKEAENKISWKSESVLMTHIITSFFKK